MSYSGRCHEVCSSPGGLFVCFLFVLCGDRNQNSRFAMKITVWSNHFSTIFPAHLDLGSSIRKTKWLLEREDPCGIASQCELFSWLRTAKRSACLGLFVWFGSWFCGHLLVVSRFFGFILIGRCIVPPIIWSTIWLLYLIWKTRWLPERCEGVWIASEISFSLVSWLKEEEDVLFLSDYCPLAAAVPVPVPAPPPAAAEDASHTSIYQKYQKYQKLLKLELISKFTINNNKPPQSHYYQYEVLPNHCHRRCVCSCFQYDPQRGCPNLQEIVSSYLFASVRLGWENVLEWLFAEVRYVSKPKDCAQTSRRLW